MPCKLACERRHFPGASPTPDSRPPTPDPMWTTAHIAGHECELFEPPERNPHDYVVLYLHGVHVNRLSDKPVFEHEFAKRGLPVVVPFTGRSWWTDKICLEFDPRISAQQHVLA